VDRQGRIVRIKYCGLALLLLVFPAFGQTPLGASRGVPAEKEISALINSKKSCVSVVPVVTSRAQAGDVVAERQLGGIYYSGCGGMKDAALAVNWYSAAAHKDDVLAECMLGRIYINGEGVKADVAQGAGWYRKAAEQGDAVAQVYLGQLSQSGFGVAKNLEQAAAWYRKAADQGRTDTEFRPARWR
jgi:TPR repeat protein